jgi:endonuclease YncB( thermonuclease family)
VLDPHIPTRTYRDGCGIAGGDARPLTFAPNNAHRERFIAAAHSAETAGLGLWSACR